MNRKGVVKDGKQNRKVNASEFIKKDKECRKLQQELKQVSCPRENNNNNNDNVQILYNTQCNL